MQNILFNSIIQDMDTFYSGYMNIRVILSLTSVVWSYRTKFRILQFGISSYVNGVASSLANGERKELSTEFVLF